MRKLVLLAMILTVALVAAPAMAEDILPVEPNTTVSGTPGEGSGPPPLDCKMPKDTGTAPLCKVPPAPPPEDTLPTSHTSEGIVADTGSDKDTDTGTVVDTSSDTARNTDDNTIKDTSTGSGDNTSTGSSDKDTSNDSGDTDEYTGSKYTGSKDTGGINQSGNQKVDSGNSDQSANIVNTGDNVNMCVGVLQVANTGNALNNQEVAQEGSDAGKIDVGGGGNITITPKLVVDCRQIILQLVTGQNTKDSSKGSNANLKGSQPTGASQSTRTSQSKSGGSQVRTGGGSQVKVISTRADAKAAQKPNAAPRALPRTGGIPIGYIALLGLATGVSLIAGGLLLYRIRR